MGLANALTESLSSDVVLEGKKKKNYLALFSNSVELAVLYIDMNIITHPPPNTHTHTHTHTHTNTHSHTHRGTCICAPVSLLLIHLTFSEKFSRNKVTFSEKFSRNKVLASQYS